MDDHFAPARGLETFAEVRMDWLLRRRRADSRKLIWMGWEASAGAVWLEVAAIATASPLVSGSLMGLGALLSPMVGLAVFVMHFRWNRGFALSLIIAALLCSP